MGDTRQRILDVANLAAFKPDVVYLHTHFLNVSRYPSARFTEADLQARLSEELGRFISSEVVKWRELIARAGIKLEQ